MSFSTFVDPKLHMEFLAPWDLPYDPLSEAITGGSALGVGGFGRQVQRWTGVYEGGQMKAADEDGGFAVAVTPLFPCTTISLAFDSNMSVVFGYATEAQGCFLYYFDTVALAFSTLNIPDAASCRVCCDDPRLFNNAASDVIFGYTRNNSLYYRIQRERYLTEHLVGPSGGQTLLRMAPNVAHRFQFKLGTYIPALAP